MGGKPGSSRRFVGVVTRVQTVFHDVVGEELFDTVASYLLDLQESHLVATGIFASDADVVCWLTNPLTQEAVASCYEDVCVSTVSVGVAGWLAIFNVSSSAVFEMSKAGLSSAVAVLAAPGAGVSVARRFASAAGAMRWLSMAGAADVLSVLRAAAGAVIEAPYAGSVPSPVAASCAQAGSYRSVKAAALSTTMVQRASSTCSFDDFGADGCSGALSAKSVPHPAPDRWGAAPAAACASGTTHRQHDRPLPLPFGSNKKRRLDQGAALSSVSNPLVHRARRSASNATRTAEEIDPEATHAQATGKLINQVSDGQATQSSNLSPVGRHPDGAPCPVLLGAGVHEAGPAAATGASRFTAAGVPEPRPSPSPAFVRSASSKHPSVRSRAPRSSLASMGAEELPMPAARHRQPLRLGPLSVQAATGDWDPLFERLTAARESTFVSGGPGVGKTTFLRRFSTFLRKALPVDGAVVVCAPMGSSAHTAAGVTYHSFFGFPKEYTPEEADASLEAARLLRQRKFAPVRRRLAQVRVLLLDEVSMIPANRLDVMVQLIEQSRSALAPACVFYVFGDFLQLRSSVGDWAFKARCWPVLFGDKVLELTKVHRQHQLHYITAIQDARFGVYSTALKELMDARAVSDESYRNIETSVLHLVPTHAAVLAHNKKCLQRLCSDGGLRRSVSADRVALDRDSDVALNTEEAEKLLKSVSVRSRDAALVDCLAPPLVPHCLNARVMYTSNAKLALGLFHGCIGYVSAYTPDGTAVVRFPNMLLPVGTRLTEVYDAGDDWVEVCCPPVDFEARVYSAKGVVAVRKQVPFVLGWAITIHRSQSLTLTEAVLDIDAAFEAGMVHTAVSRVSDASRVFVKSFNPLRLFAAPSVVQMYLETWERV